MIIYMIYNFEVSVKGTINLGKILLTNVIVLYTKISYMQKSRKKKRPKTKLKTNKRKFSGNKKQT